MHMEFHLEQLSLFSLILNFVENPTDHFGIKVNNILEGFFF